MNNKEILSCRQLSRSFEDGENRVEVLRAVDFALKTEEKVAIVGASGSGKSTLLHLMGGLDSPTEGVVEIAGTDLASLSENRRSELRNQTLGFVYQFHHLLPEFTALENVSLPLLIGRNRSQSLSRTAVEVAAVEILQRVGLGHRLHHKPAALSGGERQRAAVARALIGKPAVLLADEPTGNLDRESAQQVYELMLKLNSEVGTALILVTHDLDLAQQMDRRVVLIDGVLSEA
ncbi:MAG: lipoprotein-releasing ABC transporter ATP-binding protein LolD [Gammaproteobacteria bacterium]|jgi:lipoprotein-releasing system ATP-binding protein|nr:lipoprotein-releasing ABC transporter ATP-binding protein LolD [Gammaproteobacteria bacterium]MBT3489101.1 lipoprotein-releasing ABC transporter ATP-binding protein LolD [Gammaproteobacteria bacterium]MBT3718539.1 lipoprotein-releasing ABC transporter ATP-binding protein LolD [Gammaproteobacteria bacterium]MBT3843564.1 lipoprotein-releasing ABC transporter ATP-binding protein LolD [Gammaproteobacteria bacterium]MBT3892736.1 lipoprotein-releasing ABC transporter ATP-binding protein LolD [Gamm